MTNPNPLASQRNSLNILQYFSYYYAMINHHRFADSGLTPNVAYWINPTKSWQQCIDAQGWPNDPSAIGHSFNGGGIRVPNTDDYTGTYTIDWDGDGEFTFNIGTWTVNSSTNVTQISNGHYKTTTNGGAAQSLVVTLSGLNTSVNLISMNIVSTDPGTLGKYFRNFRFYRTGDAARLAAGKIFRLPFLQAIVDMNPASMRFMDWTGGPDDYNYRWENRAKPDGGNYLGDYLASPAYNAADYTLGAGTTHQWTLAAATATTGNPKTTPVSMQHGEVVTAIFLSGLVRTGRKTVTGITQANPGVVTTSPAHGLLTGDIVFHEIPTSFGMQQLNRRKCKITVLTTTTYSIATVAGANIDTSGFTACTASGVNPIADCTSLYGSLNVASRGDYPIVRIDGFSPVTLDNYIVNNGTYTMTFDKNITVVNDDSGTPIMGSWIASLNNSFSFGNGNHNGGIPIEICTQLVIEANQLSVSQGINNPIHMWLNVPSPSLLSIDPDYSSGSSWGVNMVDVALNGSTVNGVTYPGLKSINGPSVLVEQGNEVWNAGGFTPANSYYSTRLGQSRYGRDNYSTGNYIDIHSLRAVCMTRDIKGAFPSESRLKFVLCGQATNTGFSEARIDGGSTYLAHEGATWGSPMANHDAFGIAPYFDPWGANFTGIYNGPTGTDTVWEDNCRYLGADNSGTLTIVGGNAGVSSTTITVTSVTSGPLVVGQPLELTALTGLPKTCVTAISGSLPTLSVTLNKAVAIANGTTMHSMSNGGTNFIGAADQATAITNLVLAARGATPSDTSGETINRYCNPSAPTAGVEHTYTTYAGILCKPIVQYEGGLELDENDNAGFFKPFMIAARNSATWGTALVNYYNARGTIGCAMPSLYAWIRGNESGTAYFWAFASPDNYASHIEGQNLNNTGIWPLLGARNRALSESGLAASTSIGFSVIHGHAKRHIRMVGY